MKWPKLVRNAKTPVRVVLENVDTNSFGEKDAILDENFKCNYQESSSPKYTSEKREVIISGTVLIDGDILASLGNGQCAFSVDENGILDLSSAEIDENGVLHLPSAKIDKNGIMSYFAETESCTDVIESGYIVVFGQKHSIVKGTKARNPDGTVNFTRLDVS